MDSAAISTNATMGRYRLVEQIGRGGMAEVFTAKSFGAEGFEKLIVLKRIVPELAAHPQFVEMFIREAKLAVRLSHANIVQVFDLGKIDNGDAPPGYFIAMEYVPGVDVATLLKQLQRSQQPMPLGTAAYIAAEVAKALDHAHTRRDEHGVIRAVVHRDISPHNILLSWDGDVKVTDFGIARAADTMDEQTDELSAARASGKVAFMSPEQARAHHTDPRSDLFSLGTVLYQLIAGANPFSAPTIAETSRRVCAGEYPPLALARPDTPANLQHIVDNLLTVDPDGRTPNASALTEQLLAYAYTSGDRHGSNDLAALLATELSSRRGDAHDQLSADTVMVEAARAEEHTPVEVPRPPTITPPTASDTQTTSTLARGERREVSIAILTFGSQQPLDDAAITYTQEVFDRHGAWIEETSSHRVVAVFGLGDTDGRDAEAAVRAALLLVRQRAANRLPAVGIHSGPISIDDGGLPVRDERFAAVERSAQRLTQVADGVVAISTVTGRLVRRSFVTEPLPADMRAVTDGGFVVHRALEDTADVRLFGRRKALHTLGATLAAATRKGQQLTVIRGPSGIGKTHLLNEAKRRLEHGQFDVAMFVTRCPLHGASVPWSGLRTMVRVLCGTQEDDAPARVLEVRPRLAALGLDDRQIAAIIELLGGPLSTRASETRAALRNAFERMVTSLCNDRLHCLAWDDAQAMDRESLDLILRVMRKRRRLRLVLLLVQRGELPPLLERWRDIHIVSLSNLSADDTRRLMQWRLGARTLPSALVDYVFKCTGGHPLFVNELLRELCDDGGVQVMNGNVRVVDQLQVKAPRPLRTLITQRVSRLPQHELLLLQSLAVLGEPGLLQVLNKLASDTFGSIARPVRSLESVGLVQRVGTSQLRFSSPLYREIILEAMPGKLLHQLHARAAATYRKARLTSTGEAAERVAKHLLGAGRRAEAVEHFWVSAREKLARMQLEPALLMMLRGLQLARVADIAPNVLLGWLDDVGRTVTVVRRGHGLKDLLMPLVQQLRERGSPEQAAHANIELARALGSVNLFDEASEALELTASQKLDNKALVRSALVVAAQLAARRGMFARVIEAGEQLEALDAPDHIDTLYALVVARSMAGQPQQAQKLLHRIDKVQPTKDAAAQVQRGKHQVLVDFNARRFEKAAKHAIALATNARAHGLRYDAAAALHNLGDIYDRLGDHPRAYAAFVESITLARQLENERLTNLNQVHLCMLDGLRSPEGAEERLKTLIRTADGHGYIWDVLQGHYQLARLCVSHGHHTRARTLLTALLADAEKHGHRFVAEDVTDMLATLGTS